MTVTTARDGTVKPSSKWNGGGLIPSSRPFHQPLIRPIPSRPENLSRCTLPSRPVEEISSYRPVPSTKPALPFRPVYETYPYRPVPSSKHAPTVPSRRQNLSLQSNPAVKTCPYRPLSAVYCRHSFPSRCRDRQDAVIAMNSYYSITSTNT